MKKYIIFSSAVILLALLVAPVHGNQLTIYVSIPPQQWLVKELAGELATTEILLGKGQDPHTYEPTPRQIAGLSQAAIYFTIGMTFEKHLSKKITQTNSTLRIIDSSRGVPRRSGEGHYHDEPPSKEHGSSPEGPDPHIWLSPVNLITVARNMTESMAAADSVNRAAYEQHFTILEQKLLDLHEKIKAKLAPYDGARFFVFHPAFGYFADEYHLHQVPVEIGGKSPSPKQLFKIAAQARSENIRVLFIQPQFDPNSANVVAQAIDGKVAVLDPLAENIIVNIEAMADAIVESLSNRNTQ